jgi:hypothetical protein
VTLPFNIGRAGLACAGLTVDEAGHLAEVAGNRHPADRQIHTWLSRTASAIGSPRQVARPRWTHRTIAVLSYRCTSTSVVSIDR